MLAETRIRIRHVSHCFLAHYATLKMEELRNLLHTYLADTANCSAMPNLALSPPNEASVVQYIPFLPCRCKLPSLTELSFAHVRLQLTPCYVRSPST